MTRTRGSAGRRGRRRAGRRAARERHARRVLGGGDDRRRRRRRSHHDHHDHRAAVDHHDGRRPRSRRSPGCADPSGQPITRPALSVKVENTPDAATAGRPRPGRRRLRGGRRGRHHPLRRDVQLDGARRDRPGPLGARRSTPTSCGRSAGSSPSRAARRSTSRPSQAAPVHAVDENNQRRAGAQRAGPAAARRAAQPLRARPAAVRRRRRAGAAAGAVPVPACRRAGRRRRRRRAQHAASASRPGYDPTWSWDARHRGRGSGSIQRRPHTVVVGQPDRAARTWSSSSPTYPGEGDGIDRRRGRRVGVHRRHGARRAAGMRPDRAQPARYVDAAGAPILLRPGTHVGRAAARREPGRRRVTRRRPRPPRPRPRPCRRPPRPAKKAKKSGS